MTPQPKRSPAAGALGPAAGSPSAVSPNSSRNRGPAGAKRAAGVSDRSNWRASGNRNTRYIVGPRSRSTRCTAANSSLSVRVQSSRTSATGTSSATAKVRSRSEKRSPPPNAREPTTAPATTRWSFSARVNTRSRRASRWSTVNTIAWIVDRAASQLLESQSQSLGYVLHCVPVHVRRVTMTTDRTTDTKSTGKYANVNGINLYYETHGAGRPMILLHGGLGSNEMFGPVLPQLSEHHQVIAPDLQGHGRTADIARPIDVRLMADDIAALIDHLGLDKPDVVGYSLGGGVAIHKAAKYPAKIRRLVAASANIRPDAIYAEMRAQQGQVNAAAADFMKDTPMYQLYNRVAPRPEDFPKLLDKIGASMAKDFDFADEVRGLQVPTLIVAADADMAPPSHYVEVFKLLGGGLRDGGWMGEGRPAGGHALAILPGLTHYNIGVSPLFAAVILAFLGDHPSRA